MKAKLLVLIIMAAGLAACNKPVKGRNGVTYKNAVQYNDYIVTRQTSLMKKMLDFGKASQQSLDSAGQMLESFEKETAKMLEEIKGMPPYKKDSALRDAAINSFTFYQRVFAEDYRQILEIGKKPGITPEEAEQEINVIVQRLTKDENKYDKAFHNAQKDFAEKNKMKLRENSAQKEIEEGLKE